MFTKIINRKSKLISLLLVVIILSACNNSAVKKKLNVPEKPDYALKEFWFGDINQEFDKKIDIFYVYPTVIFDEKDENGNEIYLADISKKEIRDAAFSNQNYNNNVYAGDKYNFFAPFYRQISFNTYGLNKEVFQEYRKIAVQDILDAFRYYMENLNNGRPYFLLGHSQGSSMLIELLKYGIEDDEFERMVAAYTIGYSLSNDEIKNFENRLIPAKDSCDLNCVILFNSLTNINARSMTMPKNDICINPLIWTTDTTFAPRELHLGYSMYNKKQQKYIITPNITGVYIQDNYLICPDIDPYQCFQEEFKESFPLGNLHFMDSWLYSENLKQNMECRVRKLQMSN
ncbi:MAG: DUF3089 domain-containing protein [Bacteroidales bacterium]|jgi:hypothetical protein|nr:DUF3089 domain-containing protein [Bacteroidales bacterium]